MTTLVLNWCQAYEAGVAICGGKGYHLARLRRYGFPVPDGGVLVADVYRQLIHAPALAESLQVVSTLRAEDVMEPVAHEELGRLQQGIMDAALPMQVGTELEHFLRVSHLIDRALAVRSSAVSEDGPLASFAGIHRSVLHVHGVEAIGHAILQCFASLWTPQAVAYRRRMGFADDDVLCAVVLCAMVAAPGADEPHSAGVAFSCDPRTGRRDLVVINAARGSGERVVSGVVDPDHVEMRQARGQLGLQGRTTPGTPVLTSAQEYELAHHVWRIHWALGDGDHPQDVEWAHDGAQFWILQARPVTSLPRHTFEAIKHLPVIWSTANIKDAVPGVVSMFAWSMIQEAIDGILYAGPRSVGYEIPLGMQTIKRIDGHAYFNLTALQWCWYDFVGALPAQTLATIGGHQPEIPVPPESPAERAAARRRQKTRLQILWHLLGFNRRFRRVLREHVAEVRRIAALPWQELPNQALLDVIARIAALHERLDPVIGFLNGYASAFKDLLEAQLRKIAGERTSGLMARLLAGSGEVTSAEQGYRIVDLATVARGDPLARAWLQRHEPAQTWETLPSHSPFRHECARFLADFGHRAVYEADISNPRWHDDPGYILDQVRRLLETPTHGNPRLTARQVSAAAWAEVNGLTGWRRPLLRWLVGQVQRGFALREAGKSGMVASLWPTRHLLLELGRRLVASRHLERPEQVFHLSRADLLSLLRGYWDGRGAEALAQDRAAQREAWLNLTLPDVIIEGEGGDRLIRLHAPPTAFNGQVWRGIGVSSGRATAVARTIRHPHEGMRLGPGEILVAPSTDPGWTPLFVRASAVVMETGGYLSHGAIVAREYGLPAVVNIPDILSHIKDGETLMVDGDAATVRRIP